MTERVHHVQAAYDIVSRGRAIRPVKPSGLPQPRSIAAARERRGFTD
ncbi:hypothetical protein [Streptomyces sp. NPDC101393]